MIDEWELEPLLDKGMNREEIAVELGVCLSMVGRAWRCYGSVKANARRDEGLKKRIIREWQDSKLPYKFIAQRCGTNMKVVNQVLSDYNRVQQAGGVIAQQPNNAPLQWGDYTYLGRRVTVLEKDRHFATIVLNGDRTVIESELLRAHS